jgi:hypothetical protein
VSIEEVAQSGAAKEIDSWEMIELRQDDIECLRPFEKRLFDVSRAVWNFHVPTVRIDEKAVFGIDFVEQKAPVSEIEEQKAKDWKYGHGLWTPVDDMIDEDEGIDEDLAMEYLKKNLSIKKELESAKTPESLTEEVPAVGFGMPASEEEEDEPMDTQIMGER